MPRPLDISIRDATREDLARLQEVFRDVSLSNEGDRAVLLANPDALVFAEDALHVGRIRVAVCTPVGAPVVDGSELTGFATTRSVDEGLELEDLFVDPGWMRHGIARRLIADAVTWAASEGAGALVVTANPHAMDFYRAVGFQRAGEVQTRFGPGVRLRLAVDGPGPGARGRP